MLVGGGGVTGAETKCPFGNGIMRRLCTLLLDLRMGARSSSASINNRPVKRHQHEGYKLPCTGNESIVTVACQVSLSLQAAWINPHKGIRVVQDNANSSDFFQKRKARSRGNGNTALNIGPHHKLYTDCEFTRSEIQCRKKSAHSLCSSCGLLLIGAFSCLTNIHLHLRTGLTRATSELEPEHVQDRLTRYRLLDEGATNKANQLSTPSSDELQTALQICHAL
eukprot:6746704-Pyramimonas_sp.AAC.1